jgi:hypothetical protein
MTTFGLLADSPLAGPGAAVAKETGGEDAEFRDRAAL